MLVAKHDGILPRSFFNVQLILPRRDIRRKARPRLFQLFAVRPKIVNRYPDRASDADEIEGTLDELIRPDVIALVGNVEQDGNRHDDKENQQCHTAFFRSDTMLAGIVAVVMALHKTLKAFQS